MPAVENKHPIGTPVPAQQLPEPTPTRKRLCALRCSECDSAIGVCLPESLGLFCLCSECAPSDAALHRNLTPAEQIAVRAEETQREAQRQREAAANASLAALTAN